jgi:hypothetical protein
MSIGSGPLFAVELAQLYIAPYIESSLIGR